MKNLRTRVLAASLSALMAISAVGAVTVSAAESNTQAATATQTQSKKYYFIDTRDSWENAYLYTWDDTANGKVESHGAFPGQEVTCVGKINGHKVFEVEVGLNEDGFVLAEAGTSTQETDNIYHSNFIDGNNAFYLIGTQHNHVAFTHISKDDFDKDKSTQPTTESTTDSSTTPSTPTTDDSATQPTAPTTDDSSSQPTAPTTNNGKRIFYFVNNKNWGNVFLYSWKNDPATNSDVPAITAFPGVKLDKPVGTTKINGQDCDVYAIEVDMNDIGFVISAGGNHDQQTNDIRNRSYDGANMIVLTEKNNASVIHCDPTKDISFNK